MTHETFVSYAQNSEDVVLARAFAPDEQPGFWIDVGAGDPVLDSVTHAFSVRGWTGINIEPSAEQYERLVEQRPNEINLRCAAGCRPGFAKLYPSPTGRPGLSTLVPRIAEHHSRSESEALEPVEVEVRTLAEIVDQHAPTVVDFLKVDVEGFESEVLSGANWQLFHPRVVVVEALEPTTYAPAYAEWEPMLLAHDYRFVLFDGLNRFYVAAGEDELASALAAPANVLDGFVQYRSLLEFERAEEYALSLEAVVADERERFGTELRDLARRCRVTSDRAEHADELAANLRDDLAAAQKRGALAMGETARLMAYVDELEATRTLRYTRRARAIYAMLRRFGVQHP
jgi:FkbM family methyltransferase